MSSFVVAMDRLVGALVGLHPNSGDEIDALIGDARVLLETATAEVKTELQSVVDTLSVASRPLTRNTIAEVSKAMLRAQAALANQPVARSEDTIAVFADFTIETEEGLAIADRILMRAEKSAMSDADVHALFRVFHTIKGVAGFLELEELQQLAHDTETLLDLAREGRYRVDGEGVDVLLDATQRVRDFVGIIADAVNRGVAVPCLPSLPATLSRVNELIEHARSGVGAKPEEPPLPRNLEALLDADEAPKEELKPEEPAKQIHQTIKLDLERVDRVVEMIGELVIVESMLTHAPELDGSAHARTRTYLGQLAKISRELQSAAMLMRMVPVRSAFQRLPRIAREAAKRLGKDVQIVLEGEGTEMDRSMVDRLNDPLIHLLRNAVDHGIEDREKRLARGKPASGTIHVSAYHEGSSVVIEVRDDGGGLDTATILAKAKSRGLVHEGQELGDDEIYQLISAPGFSTASQVTEISGRGVGLDVVRRSAEAMRGRMVIKSEPGAGTTFKLVLPLTLAIIDATIVSCGKERFIIPSLSIVESIRPELVGTMGGHRELLRFRGGVLPLFRAGQIFGVEGAETDPRRAMAVVVVDSMSQRIALLVDHVIGQQQVVIRSLDGTLGASSSFTGAAIVSDGQVALIVNVDDLGRVGESFNLNALKQESAHEYAA